MGKIKNTAIWMFALLVIGGLLLNLYGCKDSPTSDTEEETQALELTTSAITAITSTSATGGGSITSMGSSAINEKGVAWNTESSPTTQHNKAVASGSGNEFSVDLTGLSPETEYYVRAYATTTEGTIYGNEVSFTTLNEDNNGNDSQGEIYWVQTSHPYPDGYTILSSNLFGENKETIFQWAPGDGYYYTALNLFYLPDEQKLYYLEIQELDDEYVERIRFLNPNELEYVASSSENSSIMAIHVSESRILWVENFETETVRVVIRSSNLDGSGVTDLYETDENIYVDYLTYNEETDQIFFIEEDGDYGIARINGDGSGYQKIVSTTYNNFWSLTTADDKIYWIEEEYFGSDMKSVIKSADLNGNNIMTVYEPAEIMYDFYITEFLVDTLNDKIYFIYEEEENDEIVSTHIAAVNSDGTGLTVLHSLDIDDGEIYSVTVHASQIDN